MSKAFIYGKMVEGENFTDRLKETKRLKANFEEGLNTIVISPRRIGKSSLVKRVKKIIDIVKGKAYIADPVFEMWLKKEYMGSNMSS